MFRLLCCYLTLPVLLLTATEPKATNPANPPPNAVHLLGLSDIAHNAKGVLKVENGNLSFRTPTASALIPLASATEFSVQQETRALVGGTAGRLLLLAPFGSGRAISMIRNGVETITIDYHDQRGGEHGAILMLPKGDGAKFAELLETNGVKRGAGPDAAVPAKQDKRPPILNKEALANAVIEIRPVTGSDHRLPDEFRMSIYEQLFEGLFQTGQFQHVYRANDKDAETKPDRLRLQLTIFTFTMGNERVRALTTFGGSTVIKARVQVLDKDQKALIDKDITGSVRGFGENINATGSLAKRVAKLLAAKK